MLFNEEYCVKLDENEARLHMSFGEMDGPMQHAVNMKKYVNGKIIYEDAADGQLYYALEQKSALTVHSTDRDLTCPFVIQIQKDPDAFVMY